MCSKILIQVKIMIENTSKIKPHRLDYLDLAKCRRRFIPKNMKLNLLISSLRNNYFSYAKMILSNVYKSENSVKNQYNFFFIPRVALPPMKVNSPYCIWNKFLNSVVRFFDGKNRKDFIDELQNLENIIRGDSCYPSYLKLEDILSNFEQASGFNSVYTITEADGILSSTEFKNIVASGHPINDYGASLQHGILSHRLQFYILGTYFLKNIDKFFTKDDLAVLLDQLTKQYPNMLDETGKYSINKIISAFYRLLGREDFNHCFDWDRFIQNRNVQDLKYNHTIIPEKFNLPDIWVQLFDRYGYAGYFSVPSTLGLLQKLGCFRGLPTIGEPKLSEQKELRTIYDITPRWT